MQEPLFDSAAPYVSATFGSSCGVRFAHVHVYVKENATSILDDISLTIPSGRVTGITGPSGAGKSALLKTITKQLVIAAGNVSLDQTEIRVMASSYLIDQVSIVPQEVRVFNDTIVANILYGSGCSLSREKLDAVLKITHLAEVVDRLPKGYRQ